MAKIKWVGVIKGDVASYQESELNKNAVKLKMPSTMSEMMIKAIPFAIPSFVAIFLSVFLKTFLSNQMVISPLFVFLGVIVSFFLLPIHELLHAVVYPKGATVSIGFDKKSFSAVALVSFPLKRARFIFMSLLPLALGLVPMLLFIALPPYYLELNGIMFGLSIMGLISPYPDFYNVFQVLRQTPKGCYLQFYKDDLYYHLATK